MKTNADKSFLELAAVLKCKSRLGLWTRGSFAYCADNRQPGDDRRIDDEVDALVDFIEGAYPELTELICRGALQIVAENWLLED